LATALFTGTLTAPTHSFVHQPRSIASKKLFATTTIPQTPERIQPDAGYVPEWENRGPGLTEEEFLRSDESKPDLAGMWECPLTRWDSDGIDVDAAIEACKGVPHCPAEIHATAETNAQGVGYFVVNKDKIRSDLVKHGAVWLRGFDLMKGVKGFREMHEALGFEPCLDPLHSSGLRKFASERDALYEEVS